MTCHPSTFRPSARVARRTGPGTAWLRSSITLGLILALFALSGCERIRLHGSGGSSSAPDIGVGVEF